MKENTFRKRKKSNIFVAIIPFFIVFIFLSNSVTAHVNGDWDWHKDGSGQHKRTLHWCWDDESREWLDRHLEWVVYIHQAASNWNNANTGWNIVYDPDNCQVRIGFKDITCPGNSGPPMVNDDGYVQSTPMTFDINPSNNPKHPASGWGTSGNDVYNPVVVAKHEFGELLRLDHTEGYDDKMRVGEPGYHNTTLSPMDIKQAKGSFGSVGKKVKNIFRPWGYFETEKNDTVFIPEGALPEGEELIFTNIINWNIQGRTNFYGGYISTAIEISSGVSTFDEQLTIFMAYTDREINGGYVECLPIYYPPLIETELKPYKYNIETHEWELIPDSLVEPAENSVAFHAIENGIYGIGGPFEFIVHPPDTPARPSGPDNGKPGIEYTYSTVSFHPDGDDVYYWFDWGDGTATGLIGPYSSGETVDAHHTWDETGTYAVKVKAENDGGWESDWSEPLSVSMPRNKATNTPFLQFLQNFLQQHPILYQLLLRFLRL